MASDSMDSYRKSIYDKVNEALYSESNTPAIMVLVEELYSLKEENIVLREDIVNLQTKTNRISDYLWGFFI